MTRCRRRRGLPGLAVLVCLAILLAGCGGSPAPPARAHPPGANRAVVHRPVRRALRFWTRALLGSAGAVTGWRTQPKTAHPVIAPARRVGALFFHNTDGNHFCTASVVDSPHHNVIATAAHCVYTGRNGNYQQDIVFVPSYQQGQAPYGVWQPTAIVVDQRWITSSDPALDIAFVVLGPEGGKNIGDILGGNRLTVGRSDPMHVRVTGYPDNADAPITCTGRATAKSPTQQRFACAGYPTGTSGSPWIAGYNPLTHTGQLVGVIGGYQQGGDTPDVSYSPAFGADVEHLYHQAVTTRS